uniref:Uncharacterized protein n=1 Tax=Arundo donax TaxID=35708 RepID=A0A0A8XRY1_ARUDO
MERDLSTIVTLCASAYPNIEYKCKCWIVGFSWAAMVLKRSLVLHYALQEWGQEWWSTWDWRAIIWLTL